MKIFKNLEVKNMFDKTKSFIQKKVQKAKERRAVRVIERAYAIVESTVGEAYVDTGVKVLIAVVLGALVLTLLYALFNDTIMPNVVSKVQELFNYAG
jgi:hypothetical protein